MVNPLQPIFDILRAVTRLGEGIWEWMAFHPLIQNHPLISVTFAIIGVVYLKGRGSNDERESSDATEEWIIDVAVGGWVSVFNDIPKVVGSILGGIGKAVISGVEKIRESENINLIGGSIIDLSIINWKTILIAVLGLMGISAVALFGWFNGLF